MERKLLAEEAFAQLRIALLEDGRLVEYRTEESFGRMRAGSIFKGRVCDILPGMQAAFVDIGEEKNAYLAQKDVLGAQEGSIGRTLRPGQEILVQVQRESDGRKGARVSMFPALPGHLLVLRPHDSGVGISKRIADAGERERLKGLLRGRCPEGMGVVLRTAAASQDEETLCNELHQALERWRRIEEKAAHTNAPCLLSAENDLLEKDLRDLLGEELTQIVVSGDGLYERAERIIRRTAPKFLDRLRRYGEELPLFDLYNLEKELRRAA